MQQVFVSFVAFIGLAGCGSAVQPPTEEEVRAEALQPPAPLPTESPAPEASPVVSGPTSETLTVYSLTETRTVTNGGSPKTYTSTGSCALYRTGTFCWDDGVKSVTYHQSPYPDSVFRFSYFNMSQDAVGYSHANGGLQADLLAAPTEMTPALELNMAPGVVDGIFAAGVPIDLDCTLSTDTLTCGALTFSVGGL